MALSGAILASPVLAETPKRVVSMNLCTDQLAMLLADPEQLLSVSYIASDPRSSAMVQEAQSYVANYGRAEEIYLMRPDLVLAGAYTSRAAVNMLMRLGVPVEVFQPASSMEDVQARMRQMGAALGQEPAAEDMVRDFDSRLEDLQVEAQHNPRALLYAANGYTLGDQTLSGQILSAAGFDNAAVEAGYQFGGRMPLEILAMTAPDLVVSSGRYPGGSRSEEILDHPVVQAFRDAGDVATITNRDWICGTPYVLRAVDSLRDARAALIAEDPAAAEAAR